MKSLNEWRQINEFAGPVGQVDPMGQGAAPMPSVVPQSPAGAARPGMAQNGMGQQPTDPQDELPVVLQNFLRVLKGKSPMQIMQVRSQFEQAVQSILAAKSQSAGRMGMMTNYRQAKAQKDNWGHPAPMPN